jgi:uncharacterized membrane protein
MICERRWVAVAVVALALTGCARELRSASDIDLGIPVDINSADTILAVVYDGVVPSAVLLTGPGGSARRVAGPDGSGFLPRALNDHGVVAGELVSDERGRRAVTWSSEGGFVVLPRPPDTFQSWATDVNGSGTVAFNAYSPSGGPGDGAYVWNPGDPTATRLPDPEGVNNGRASAAEGINDAGVVVGASGWGSPAGYGRAVRWEARTRRVTFLGPAGLNSSALDVNERGTAVGPVADRAAAWPATGSAIDLGPGLAGAINDLEVVVGQSGSLPRATMWFTWTRRPILLGELREGAVSNAVALNNRRAVGSSDGRAVQFVVP